MKNNSFKIILSVHSRKSVDDFWLKIWDLSGTKVWRTCKSCRSRQELSNKYLLFSIYLQDLVSIQPRTSLMLFFNFSTTQGFNFSLCIPSRARGWPVAADRDGGASEGAQGCDRRCDGGRGEGRETTFVFLSALSAEKRDRTRDWCSLEDISTGSRCWRHKHS